MDAAACSTQLDDEQELDRLRQRAYGPDADIHGDPAAQARLTELETSRPTAMLPRNGAPTSSVAPATHPLVPGDPMSTGDLAPAARQPPLAPARPSPIGMLPRTTDPSVPRPQTREEPPHETGATRDPVPQRIPRWRKKHWWRWIGVALAVVMVASVLVAVLAPRPPDVSLGLRAEQPAGGREALDPGGSSAWFGVVDDQARLHDRFRGLDVWSGPTRNGTMCVFVEAGSIVGVGCAPPGLDPTIDLVRWELSQSSQVPAEVWDDLPVGSLIRLVLKGDRVDVWLVAARGPEPGER